VPDIDALKFLMAIIKIISVAAVVLTFAYLFTSFNTVIKSSDLERFSVEMSENIASSQLTTSRYIFDRNQLDSINQESERELASPQPTLMLEPDFARTCGFAYHVEITDLVSNNKWYFGYNDPASDNVADPVVRNYYAGTLVYDTTTKKYTVDPARMVLTAYDTIFVRETCAIEKAFMMKQVQQIPRNINKLLGLKRDGNAICSTSNINNVIKDVECRFVPDQVKLQDFSADIYRNPDGTQVEDGKIRINEGTLVADNTDLVMKFYPIKEGSTTKCYNLDAAAIAGPADSVDHVLVCLEAKK
jgi:hypothetical protein